MHTLALILAHLFCSPLLADDLIGEHKHYHSLLLKKYLQKGGTLENIRKVKHVKDLASLIPDRGIPGTVNIKGRENRFNFVFSQKGEIRMSSLMKSQPHSVSHGVLSMGEALYSAGEIFLFRSGERVSATLTNRSKKFCSSFKSLKRVEKELLRIGLKPRDIHLREYPSRFCNSL